MNITLVAGARPNFMKIAPLIRAINDNNRKPESPTIHYRLVHTGQHYDRNMSGSFFEQLGIPDPDINLDAGGGSQAEQTAKIMIGFENELEEHPADLVVVVGDVTSTLACCIVAKKANCKVAHIEGGIRSGDWSMPEEINRIVTDSITDYFFTTSDIANTNLRKSGIAEEQIFFVGNTMIDTLLHHRKDFFAPPVWDELGLEKGGYWVMTLHRPANVDEQTILKTYIDEIVKGSLSDPVIFPVHPRTAKQLRELGITADNLQFVDPLSYLEFNFLVERAKGVVTDSGGITEETTVMGIPCLTLRDNTERPETISVGTNELIGTDPSRIKSAMQRIQSGKWKKGDIPQFWDGKTAERIIHHLHELL